MTIDNIDELYAEIKRLKTLESEVKEYIFKTIKNKTLSLEDR